MVSTFNTRVQDAGLSSQTVHAMHGDLFDKADPSPEEFAGPEWQNFDIATVGFGFHHFEDVVHSARQLKERLRPGGVLIINDFLEGGDVQADEQGKAIEGSEGNHAVHSHGHGHGHGHRHGHGHGHGHGDDGSHGHAHGHGHGHDHSSHEHNHHHHHDSAKEEKKHDVADTSPEFKSKMSASVVVPHFTIDGVKKFFTEAGFVDVDVITMEEKSYMEFAGKKLWRTILFARGRRPFEESEKSEL
jgi:SAM-dependent methyltransferase